jgi:hypothetical protein
VYAASDHFVWHYDLRAMAAQHKDLIRTIVRRQTENVI